MINGFNKNKSNKQCIKTKKDKNKVDGSNKTILNTTQKIRIFKIANAMLGDDFAKFLQNGFYKQLKKIEAIELEETKEKIEAVKNEVAEQEKVKKEKKKFSIRSGMRKIRILMHVVNFAIKIYDNFKKFKKETDSIIAKHFKDQGFTLKDVLTDEATRDLFLAELESAINEIAISFYKNVLINSIAPTLEFITKMALEKVLTFLDNLRDKIEAAEDVLEDKIESTIAKNRLKKFAKNMTGKKLGYFSRLARDSKILYHGGKVVYNLGKGAIAQETEIIAKKLAKKGAQKVLTKVAVAAGKTAAKAAVHAAIHAAAVSSLATGPGAVVGAALELGLLVYDVWDFTTSYLEAQEMYEKAEGELHNFGVGMIKMSKEIEKLTLNNEIIDQVEKLKGYSGITPQMVAEMRSRGISLEELKIEKYLKIYERYNSDLSNIINDFSNEDEFEPDEIIALKERNLDYKQYRSYKFVISKWANFFKKFTDGFSDLFTKIIDLIPKVESPIEIEDKEIEDKEYIRKENKIEIYKKENKIPDKLTNLKLFKAKKLSAQKKRTFAFSMISRNNKNENNLK